jgi:hypothetical protein
MPKTTLTGMSHKNSMSATGKIGAAFKGIHRRMSSIGKSTKSTKSYNSPYEAYKPLPSVTSVPSLASSANSLAANFLSRESPHLHDERDTRLFSLDKLEISDKHRKWFEAINMAVRDVMNSAEYDASHDYEHIQRVLMNANRL